MDSSYDIWIATYLAALAGGHHRDDAEDIAYASVKKAHIAKGKLR
jgi:hypothetical protein